MRPSFSMTSTRFHGSSSAAPAAGMFSFLVSATVAARPSGPRSQLWLFATTSAFARETSIICATHAGGDANARIDLSPGSDLRSPTGASRLNTRASAEFQHAGTPAKISFGSLPRTFTCGIASPPSATSICAAGFFFGSAEGTGVTANVDVESAGAGAGGS